MTAVPSMMAKVLSSSVKFAASVGVAPLITAAMDKVAVAMKVAIVFLLSLFTRLFRRFICECSSFIFVRAANGSPTRTKLDE